MPARAEVLFVARDDQGKTVELTNEPCKMMAKVSNLGRRAVWTEPGKVFEGCWRVQFGVVVTFWDDLSAVVIPINVFTKVTTL